MTKIAEMIAAHCRAERAAVATNVHGDCVVVSKQVGSRRLWSVARVDAVAGRVVQAPYVYSSRGQAVAQMRRRGVPREATVVLEPAVVPSYPYGCYTSKLD